MIRSIFGVLGAAAMALVFWASAYLGMFFNTLFVFLMTAAGLAVVLRIVGLVRKDVSFRLFKLPKERATRPYWIQVVIRATFYLLCALAVKVAIIPAQFEEADLTMVNATLVSSATILIVLSLLPLRRIYWSMNALFALLSIVLIWQIAVASDSEGEGVVLSPLTNEPWLVAHGTGSFLTNHHHFAGSQKYAVDLIPESDAPRFVGELEEFDAYGAEILAPIAGKIIALERNESDLPVGTMDSSNPAGNYLLIQAQEAVYVLIGHLQKESLLVEVGQRIEVGEVIARCGNSGNTSQPHIHVQVMDRPDMWATETRAIPLLFEKNGLHLIPRRNDKF